ncbi:MAG: hypothetical protein ACPGCK_05530, partial [Flavobacteriaceae bacterium]
MAVPPFYRFIKGFALIGLLLGFGCGFLYGVGGFFHDLLLTELNTGTLLALNALWGMPLIGGGVAAMVGFFLWVLFYL